MTTSNRMFKLISPLFFLSTLPFSAHAIYGHPVLQIGLAGTSLNEDQFINISGLIGDQFNATNPVQYNGLIGVGYFVDAFDRPDWNVQYGFNAFYFGTTQATGLITQENFATNLSYQYDVNNYPIYFMAKSWFKVPNPKLQVSVDAGIGPNFLHTSQFSETSLDGITVPDNSFSGNTKMVWSATAGVGVRWALDYGKFPMEIDYRFFYLGQSTLSSQNSQINNPLSTGYLYANALVFTFNFS